MATCESCDRRISGEIHHSITGRALCSSCNAKLLGQTAGIVTGGSTTSGQVAVGQCSVHEVEDHSEDAKWPAERDGKRTTGELPPVEHEARCEESSSQQAAPPLGCHAHDHRLGFVSPA